MRHIVIGDIHGCLEEHDELLEACKVTYKDTLVYLGDLLDKGPSGPALVNTIRNNEIEGQPTIIILGNHEENNIRWHNRQRNQDLNGVPNIMQDPYGHHQENYFLMEDYHYKYLRTRAFLAYKIPNTNFLAVHGGVDSEYQFPEELRWDFLTNAQKRKFELPLRLRYVDENGKRFLTELRDSKIWAEEYDGRFGHIFFGHTPWEQDVPKEFQHATGMDLGCVSGGKLAAAIVIPNEPVSYVTVDAKKAYWP